MNDYKKKQMADHVRRTYLEQPRTELRLSCSECSESLPFEVDNYGTTIRLRVEPCDNLKCSSSNAVLRQAVAEIALNEKWDAILATDKCGSAKGRALTALRAHNARILDQQGRLDATKT